MNRRSFLLVPLLATGAAFAQSPVRCENPVANFAGSCNLGWPVPQLAESRLREVGDEYIKQFLTGIDIVANEAGASGFASRLKLRLERPNINVRAQSIPELDELINGPAIGNAKADQARISVISVEAFASEMNLYRSSLLPAMVELEGKLYLIERITWHGWQIRSSRIIFDSADLLAIGKATRLKIDRKTWEQIRFVCFAKFQT